jgi:hypothetical protein
MNYFKLRCVLSIKSINFSRFIQIFPYRKTNIYTRQFYGNFHEPTFDDGRISVAFEVRLVEILILSGGENVNVRRQRVMNFMNFITPLPKSS